METPISRAASRTLPSIAGSSGEDAVQLSVLMPFISNFVRVVLAITGLPFAVHRPVC